LPTNLAIEDMMQLFKGSSSHWMNEEELVPGKFGWGRGYGAFSVSHSGVAEVARYIAEQEEHHSKRHDEKTGETVRSPQTTSAPN